MNCSSILINRLRFPFIVWALLVGTPFALCSNQTTLGLRDPGELKSLRIETGRTINGEFLLDGPDSSQQLVVTGQFAGGQLRDLTRAVAYDVQPAGVIAVSPSGLVLPRANGLTTITV